MRLSRNNEVLRELNEAIVSWVFFRVMECLNRTPPDVEDAKTYALDGVRYLLEGKRPERFDA